MRPASKILIPCLVATASLLAACGEDNTQSRVVLGTSEDMFELTSLQYQLPFVVQVTDIQGNPARGVSVSFRLKPTGFIKGRYVATDTDGDGQSDSWVATTTAECPSEDANGNGALDGGEDTDGDGILDPRNAATIIPHPDETPTIIPGSATLQTDDSGFGYFTVAFPKSEASWVHMQMTAEASDGLPGNTVNYNFTLPVLLQDVSNVDTAPPGGLINSPYGTANACNDPS